MPKPYLIEPLEPRTLLTVMANGIDPANLGKGDWLVTLSSCITHLKPVWGSSFPAWANTDLEKLMYFEKNTMGMQYVIVKAGDGNYTYPLPSGSLPPSQGGVLPPAQYTTTVVQAAHDAGLKIFPYFFIYGGSSSHKTTTDSSLSGEIANFNSVMNNVGGDGAVFDIEGQYSGATGGPNSAITTYLQGIGRTQSQVGGTRDNLFMAYSTFPYVSLHPEVPYLLLGDYLDAAMPQPYWETLGNSPTSSSSRSPTKGQSLTGVGGPTRMVKDMDSEYRMMSLESPPRANIWNGHPESIKPVIPTGQSYNGATGAEITEFVNALKTDTTAPYSGGYKSVNWFDADFNTADQRTAIIGHTIGDLPGAAVNVSPSSGSSTSTHTNLLFTWNAATKATNYDVILDGVTIGTNISATSFTYTSRILTGSHSWHVNANDIIGTTVGSNTSFTRSALFTVGQTIQVFGTGSGLNTYSTSTGTTAAKTMADGSIGTIVSGPTAFNGFDRWQIQWKGDAQGTTFWSAENWLQLAPSPSAPTIVSPADGTVTTTKPTLLDWNDVTNATSYDVFLDSVKVGNGIIASQYSLDSSLTVADHNWQIVAKNSQASANGATWIFKVVPLAPTGLSATDNSFSTKVALAWTAAANASGYNVYRNTTNNSATASSIGSTTSATTYDDATAVAGTPYFYWVKAKNSSGTEGAFSAADSGVRSTDNVAPTVTATKFDPDTTTHKVVFTFSEALLTSSVQAGDVSVISRDVLNATPFSPVSVSYDGATNKATFSFSGELAEGYYRATLAASSVLDTANNSNGPAVDVDFSFLTSDGDGSGAVDIQDFNILAGTFGKSGLGFTQGNYDYSTDGTISITDFNVLAANFGRHLSAPVISRPDSMQTMATSSISKPTATATVAKEENQTDLLSDAGLL